MSSRPAQARVNASEINGHGSVASRAIQPVSSAGSGLERDGLTRLLTADDLAARWSVTVKQVYRLAREGDLPAVKVGRYYRFRLSSVQDWEARQEGASHA
ncbi:MAG: helix-turn-helix domain-containing protein [Solirubrobacteraceae bacterium]|nr:helix-turn-helix domain-containing protein [Solirubrobacteraceae bacterium]